eukprot:PhF_6_TR43577/c0_g1_i1/m.66926
MADLDGFKHFIKRGTVQMKQMLGRDAANSDTQYEDLRKTLLKSKNVVKSSIKHLDDLVHAVEAVGNAYMTLTKDFDEFSKLFEVEATVGCDVDFLSKTVRLLQVELDQFRETIKANGIRILNSTLTAYEPIEALHSEMKKVTIDMQVVRSDVVELETNINTNAKTKDKDEIALPGKQAQLKTITERYERIVAEGKERMETALGETNASGWSVFGIVFRQSQQNYTDNAKLFKDINVQMTSLKNQQESAKKLTEERASRMRQEHLQSAELLWQQQQQLSSSVAIPEVVQQQSVPTVITYPVLTQTTPPITTSVVSAVQPTQQQQRPIVSGGTGGTFQVPSSPPPQQQQQQQQQHPPLTTPPTTIPQQT